MPRRCFVGWCLVLLALLAAPAHAADDIAGAWQMIGYDGTTAAVGPAEGLLVVADGRFSLVYTMAANGRPSSARAHAGTYTLDGETLTFHVAQSFEFVEGRGSVAGETSDHKTRAVLRGDTLTVTFSNGGVQRFRRVASR